MFVKVEVSGHEAIGKVIDNNIAPGGMIKVQLFKFEDDKSSAF